MRIYISMQRSPSCERKKRDFMKRVITYGTFDLLHYGHINLLRRAKSYGDYLIVALSTDEFNWNSWGGLHDEKSTNSRW